MRVVATLQIDALLGWHTFKNTLQLEDWSNFAILL